MPDNTPLNPGTLNTWLKSNNGNFRNGLVNWVSLQRLSKIAPHSGSTIFNALEFSKVNSANIAQLTSDIQNGNPPILEVPDHYVVAKGIQGSSFSINDPFYARLSLNEYGNTFLSMRRFIPSNTDLSYIVVVADENVDVLLVNPEGDTTGDQGIEQPIGDPIGGATTTAVPLKILYLPKPETGTYRLNFSSPNQMQYTSDIYGYDIDGNLKKETFIGKVGNEEEDDYAIEFNKDEGIIDIIPPPITFGDLRDDIKEFYEQGKIKKLTYGLLLIELGVAEKVSVKSRKTTEKLLIILRATIQREKGRGIGPAAANVLIDEVNSLISQYN